MKTSAIEVQVDFVLRVATILLPDFVECGEKRIRIFAGAIETFCDLTLLPRRTV